MVMLTNTMLMLFSFLFLSSAYSKLSNKNYFIKSIKEYQLLPLFLVKPAAFLIAVTEVFSGIMILIPKTHEVALFFMVLLLLSYSSAIGINLLRGRKYLDCGCNGQDNRTPISVSLLARNVGLMVLSCVLISMSNIFTETFSAWVFCLLMSCFIIVSYSGAKQLITNYKNMLARHGQ